MARSSTPSSRNPCLLDWLDEHLLLQVLRRIPDGFDRRNWRLACKSFYELECLSRKRLQLLRAEPLQRILQRFQNVEELDLSVCAGVSDEYLLQAADLAGRRLLSINLRKVPGFSSIGLFCLTGQCGSLMRIDLSYCSCVEDVALLALSQLSNLEKLSLTGCLRITDVGLEFLAAGCRKLKALDLKGCIAFTDAGLRHIAAGCKDLTFLDLSFTEITEKGVKYVSELESLKTLSLMSCNNVGDKALRYLLANCKSLVNLDVSRCQNVTSLAIGASSDGRPALLCLNLSQLTEMAFVEFEAMKSTQYLRLDGCEITGNSLDYIAVGCKQLQELSLSKSKGVTDQGIALLISTCRDLRKLDLTCCMGLTEATLVSVAKNFIAIRSLQMESCPMVTDDSLNLLFQNCHYLEELDVTDCNVTDAGLVSIGNCKLLKILKLAFCNGISGGLLCVGSGCSNLVELDLYRCRSVEDHGVAAIVNGCPKLKVFNLSYCSRITDASMRSLARLGKLYQLEIRGCSLITSDGLREVATGCKQLVELDLKRCTHVGDTGVAALEHLCPDLRQINVSYCPLTNAGMMALAKLRCLQNMKLVHLDNVSIDCFARALLHCESLKKVKLLCHMRSALSPLVVEALERRGCRLRWMDKPLNSSSMSININSQLI